MNFAICQKTVPCPCNNPCKDGQNIAKHCQPVSKRDTDTTMVLAKLYGPEIG